MYRWFGPQAKNGHGAGPVRITDAGLVIDRGDPVPRGFPRVVDHHVHVAELLGGESPQGLEVLGPRDERAVLHRRGLAGGRIDGLVHSLEHVMVELAGRPGAGGAAAVHEELLEGPAALRDPGHLGGPEPVRPAREARDRAAAVEDRMGPRLGLVDHRRGGRPAVGRLEDHRSGHRISPVGDHDGDRPGGPVGSRRIARTRSRAPWSVASGPSAPPGSGRASLPDQRSSPPGATWSVTAAAVRPGQGGLKEEGQGNGGQGESEGRHGRIPGRDRASPGARSPRTAMRDLNWRVTRRGLPFHAVPDRQDHVGSDGAARLCEAAVSDGECLHSACGSPRPGPPAPGDRRRHPFRPGVRPRPRRHPLSASPSSRPSGRRAP